MILSLLTTWMVTGVGIPFFAKEFRNLCVFPFFSCMFLFSFSDFIFFRLFFIYVNLLRSHNIHSFSFYTTKQTFQIFFFMYRFDYLKTHSYLFLVCLSALNTKTKTFFFRACECTALYVIQMFSVSKWIWFPVNNTNFSQGIIYAPDYIVVRCK